MQYETEARCKTDQKFTYYLFEYDLYKNIFNYDKMKLYQYSYGGII